MKITILLFVLGIIPAFSSTYSQETLLTLHIKAKKIGEVFRNIEKKSEYVFFFSDEIRSEMERKIDIRVEEETLDKILDKICKETGLSYEIIDRQVTVTKAKKEKIHVPALTQTQKKVSGRVTDNKGIPLIGANITVKGTVTGTITDVEGRFDIEVKAGETLVISYVGCFSKSIVVGKKENIIVQLLEDDNLMNEIVVTGYGTALKRPTLTGAITTLKSEEIARSSSPTTSGALVGKIAGLNTRQDDGRPGSTTKINIRNMGNPLFVIDGIQQNEGQFNQIDYNDIESITVLKDASAAIYGLQAANGVIVVTTKKGKLKSQNTVSINARYGWQEMMQYPRPADAETYIRSYIQSDAITHNPNPNYTLEDLKKWQEGKEKNYRPFDWYDYIFETSPLYYLGANVSGGSDKIKYYIGVSNTTQESVVVNYGNFTRTNVQISLEANITNRFKLGATMSGRIEKKQNPGVPGDDIKAPFLALYRNLPTVRPYANDNPKYPAKTSSYGDSNFAILNYDISGKAEETFRVAQLNFNAEYEIIGGLKLKGVFSYFYSQKYADNQEYTYKLYKYDEQTDTYPAVFSMDNPFRSRNVYRKEEMKGQLQLTYDKKINEHTINAFVSAESFTKENPEFNIHSIPPSNSIHLIDYQSIDKFDDYGNREEARLGYIGRINYNYEQKYLLELAARYDGSWKFPPDHRWGFFPSASIGWRISEEKFWHENKVTSVFSDLKLRASYGLLGDDNVSGYAAFDYMDGYNYNKTGAVLDGEYYIGAEPRGLPVRNISWVKAKILDVGIDFGFFNNQLIGSLDYFSRKRTGLPASRYDVQIPEEAGFELPKENLNSDSHKGMDGSVTWHKNTRTFFYSIGANFTYSRCYDWHQYKPQFSNSWDEYRNSKKKRFNSISWGYEAIGQFQSWEEIANYPIDNDRQGNKTLRPGDIKYKDVNGDRVINSLDERPVGYAEGSLPLLNYGFNFMFQWNGFDLAFDLTGSSFATWTQDRELRVPFLNSGNSPQYTLEDQWHLADPSNASSELIPGKYPTMIAGNNSHSNYWNSTFWKKNVSYIKLRNAELGYTLPSALLQRVRMKSLRLYVSGQNLFYLANVDGIDPEITSNSGIQYPTTRVISLGVNIKF